MGWVNQRQVVNSWGRGWGYWAQAGRQGKGKTWDNNNVPNGGRHSRQGAKGNWGDIMQA